MFKRGLSIANSVIDAFLTLIIIVRGSTTALDQLIIKFSSKCFLG